MWKNCFLLLEIIFLPVILGQCPIVAFDNCDNEEYLLMQLKSLIDYITNLKDAESLTNERIQQETLNELQGNIFGNFSFDSSYDIDNFTIDFDKELPNLDDLLAIIKKRFIALKQDGPEEQQQAELADFGNVLEDVLDETRTNVQAIGRKMLSLNTILSQLNKTKLLKLIVKAVKALFKVASQVSRAAYCIYMHIPEFKVSLHYLGESINCYKNLILTVKSIQNQTLQTVNTLRGHLYDLADVYPKFEMKKTLLGKILTIVLNAIRIGRQLNDAYASEMNALNEMSKRVPQFIQNAIDCGRIFTNKIPFLIQTIKNVTHCVTYKDKKILEHDFHEADDNFSY